MMAKKRDEKGIVRAAIQTTAKRLFTENGIHGTSLGDIAGSAKLSKGTLYYYYPLKNDLVLEIAHLHADAITYAFYSWVYAIDRQNTSEGSLSALIESILSDTELCKLHVVICAEAAQGNAPLRELLSAKYNEWSVILEMGTLRIQPRETQVLRDRAALFFTMLDGCILDCAAGTVEANVPALVKILLAQ